jgi:DNA-binding CsgD family transcriptional regulator
MASFLPDLSVFAFVCPFSFPFLSSSKTSGCSVTTCLALIHYGSAFCFPVSLRISWARREQAMQAARFWGASEGTTITPDLAFYSWFANIVRTQLGYEQLLTRVRAQLGEEVFITAWNEGQTMTVEQLLGKQGSETEVQQHMSIASSSPNPTGLTAREVLRLLAQGLTSAQIAQKLVIGVVTVNFHVRSIYIKLGVSSRSAATRYALEHNLV